MNVQMVAPAGRTGTILLWDGTSVKIDASGYVTVDSMYAPALLAGGFVPLDPSQMATLFGNATYAPNTFSFFGEEGNLYRVAANPVAGNGADTADDVLGGIVIPANAFDKSGRGLCITASGKFAANGQNKRYRLWLNPTLAGNSVANGIISGGNAVVGPGVLLLDSGTQTGNGVGWQLSGNLFKYGAAGSNTQFFQGSPVNGATHGGILTPVFSTMDETSAMTLVVTGASQTSGSANDTVLNFFEVNAMN